MSAPATIARETAVHFEAKKTGFGQAQDGWSLTLRIQDLDVPAHVRDAKKGTRYLVALVEIGDNEEPVQRPVLHPAVDRPRPVPPTPLPAGAEKERRRFATQPYAQQAALRCNDPVYWAFLRETCPHAGPNIRSTEDAKIAVRILCDVDSRADIQPDTEAETKWLELEQWFSAWKTKERAMA